MKKELILLITIIWGWSVQAQDVPIFTQKLTNSFFYNPAVAGHTYGSMTFSHRQTFDNLIANNFVSFHTPLANHRLGAGASVFTDKFSFVQRTYASAAMAYHINFSSYNNLSFGLSADYTGINFDFNEINFDSGSDDPIFGQLQNDTGLDFSFGMHYQHQYFKLGIAANRLVQNWFNNEDNILFDGFYSVMGSGLIPFADRRDVLEPTFNYVSSATNSLWNAGLYYTYDDAVMLGGAYRQNDIISMTASVKLAKKIMLGYTHEISNGNVNLGSTSEIALRFDFSNYNYQERFKEDYKAAVSYRRKALNTTKPGKIGSSNPAKAKKKNIRKINSFKSPSSRYSNNKKLPNIKRKKPPLANRRKFNKQRKATKKRYKKGKN